MLQDLVARREPLTPHVVRRIHALILRAIDDDDAGCYRTVPVAIAGSRHVPPPPVEVPPRMDDLLAWYRAEAQALHPVRRAAHFHHR